MGISEGNYMKKEQKVRAHKEVIKTKDKCLDCGTELLAQNCVGGGCLIRWCPKCDKDCFE